MERFEAMTTEEINNRIHELTKVLDFGISEDWDAAYKEYCELNIVLDNRYREENEGKFLEFYKEYIEGKSLEEIDPEDWSYYSDWHKDMYGFRPRMVA